MAARGHRGRQGARERAAAEMGERGSGGRRRAHGGGGVECIGRDVPPALDAAGVRRQAFPDPVLGERWPTGTTIMETPAVRLWHLGDDIGIVSFKSKANTIGEDVLDGIHGGHRARRTRMRGTRSLADEGAVLARRQLVGDRAGHQGRAVERDRGDVAKFQQTSLRFRYSLVPTVAAVRGMALGGSCEFILHCDRSVAALESYIGLVEAGVGLLPGGGGCKEIAVRAAQEAARGAVGSQLDQLPFLRTYFQTVAMARVSRSASEAKDLGFLRAADLVVFNRVRSCSTSRGRRRGRSRKPAIGRRLRRATCRSPAAPGSRRSK